MTDPELDRRIRRTTRRSFLAFGAAAAGAAGAWTWVRTRRPDGRLPWPLRRALEVNEQLARDWFASARRAPEFPPERARNPRPNGRIGLDDEDFDPSAWTLRLEGLAGRDEPLELTLNEIRRLPRVESVTELKCVEGWSEVVRWEGCPLREIAARCPPGDDAAWVALETPDGEYYVGLDMAAALHPQTLLCYGMNGAALAPEHGAPLRLVIPVKYGVKNIKRIGTLRFTGRRPPDYWAERGYDWYLGL